MLNQRKRKFEFTNELHKTQSTIAREINRHKILKLHNSYNNVNNYNYKYFVNCKVCTGKCKIFQPISCKDRDRNIGACNNYPKLKSCKLDKYFIFQKKHMSNTNYTILNNHPEIKFCEKIIYNYIEMRLSKDLGVTNLTLKRKVKRRLSKKKFLKKKRTRKLYRKNLYRLFRIQNKKTI